MSGSADDKRLAEHKKVIHSWHSYRVTRGLGIDGEPGPSLNDTQWSENGLMVRDTAEHVLDRTWRISPSPATSENY